jgi:L-asparaginase
MVQDGSAQRDPARDKSPARVIAAFDPNFEPLLAVVRGRAVESVHRGAFAVVDAGGALLGAKGDPFVEVVLRSAAKPFQAAAVVASGAADGFSLSSEEIAIIAASHSGSAEQVAVVTRLLERADLTPEALACGSVEHMCSGKHAGMLLMARHLGVSPEGYEREDHPAQRAVAAYLETLMSGEWAGARRDALFAGYDSCGVPAIRTSVYEAARLYARLAAGATPPLARVRDAMMAHPVLVAGEGRADTQVMRAAAGQVVAKGGAEGVEGIGLLSEGKTGSPMSVASGATAGASGGGPGGGPGGAPGVGCVIKIEDGSARPLPALLAQFLRVWDCDDAAGRLERDYPLVLTDSRGTEVGRLDVLVEPATLRRPTRHAAGVSEVGPKIEGKVTVSRGDERDILRFLREQWPAADEEYFGHPVEWTADPYALAYRRAKKIVAVLKGHFIGGVASVDELMVGQGSRGSGLGSLLLGRFEDEARRRGCARVILRAVKDSRAEDFYRGRGYHREYVQYGYEFGHDYVRLAYDLENALGDSADRAGAEKGAL